MTFILEFRERIRSFYGKYEAYLLPVIKFLLALTVFLLIDHKIGYMKRLNSVPLLLILSLACSILPVAVMLLTAGVLITLHCYALSLPVGVMMLVLFVIMYLLYFRFAPRCAYNALLSPAACMLGIPYVMPVAGGLLQQPLAVIPTICGIITYYFLKGVMANETSLGVMGEDEDFLSKLREIINQFAGNREMYLVIGIFAAVTLVVYVIRRLSVDHAWTFAIVTGMLIQYLGFFIGYTQIGMSSMAVQLTAGCSISALILLMIQFFFFDLDYTRTERVQFEDDEYYYYVKAVPKRYVSTGEKTVKKISGSRKRRENRSAVTREEIMEDMDLAVDDEEY